MTDNILNKASVHLALMTRWYGPDNPKTVGARRALIDVKRARAQAEADRLAAELDAMSAAS